MKLNLNNFGKKLKITKQLEKPKEFSEEAMFIGFVDKLYSCWEKSNKLYEAFKINTLEYEESYYQVIEDLIFLKYGLWKAEIILWYIFGRIDINGKSHPLILSDDDTKEEEEILINSSKELWDFLNKLENEK